MVNQINAALDWETIRDDLAAKKHLVVPDIFEQSFANKIEDCLKTKVPWQIAYRDGEKDVAVNQQELRARTPEQNRAFHKALMTQAQREYQFYYNRYPMIDAYVQGLNQGLFLHEVTEYLNGEDFLKFARFITGDPEIRKSEPQATCYIPGNFLKLHNDFASKEYDRRFALVFNFTRRWESDWGGLLQLVDDNQVKETITPGFNSVSILKLPQRHQVSYVAPYATEQRLTVTTWLRAD